MERLTYKKGEHYYTKDDCIVKVQSVSDNSHLDVLFNCLDKLGQFEDAEEQGLLLRLRCKVGDTVYEIQPLTKRITERLIKSIVVCNAPYLTIMYKSGYDYSILHEDFGKTVFLTKEEAEQALKQMGE